MSGGAPGGGPGGGAAGGGAAAGIEAALRERGGRREVQEIRFRCPAHPDRHPSARWHPGKRTWFCDACKTGGGWRDLAARLGLASSEAAAGGGAGRGTGAGEVIAAYAYRDAAGRTLYEVVRKRPKAFACRRPDGAGGWIWNLQGVERVLYRLPETLAAVARGETVYVTEGEQDAEAVAALGLCATTHHGGAGKWRPEYGEALRGARVVLLPDHDEAGRRHAAVVAASLGPLAGELRVLDLPGLVEKGDVSDWIAAESGRARAAAGAGCAVAAGAEEGACEREGVVDGKRPGEREGEGTEDRGRQGEGDGAGPAAIGRRLAELAAWAPLWRPAGGGSEQGAGERVRSRVKCMADVQPEPVEFLWYPYLPLRKLTLLEGDPGQGKSWIAVALAAAGSRGLALPGDGDPRGRRARTGRRAREPFRTLFLTAEDGLGDTLRPRIERLGGDCAQIWARDLPLSLGVAADLAWLERELEAIRPRLLVLDPIVGYLGPRTDIYRANEVRSVLAPLVRLAERHGCAALAVRHLNKVKGGRCIYAGQGSIDFTAAARSVVLAGCAADDPRERALVHIKSNLAPLGRACGYRIEKGCFAWTGGSRLCAADLLAAEAPAGERSAVEEARAFLRSALGGATLPASAVFEAARRAGIADRTLKRAKHKESIQVMRQGFGSGSVWLWRYPEGAEPEMAALGAEGGQGGEGGLTKSWPSSEVGEALGGEEAASGRDGEGADPEEPDVDETLI